jgi:hypothetical protein
MTLQVFSHSSFRSLINFEWIFVENERYGSSFSHVCEDIQFSQHYRKTLEGVDIGNDFLNWIPIAQEIRTKIDK